jgi:GNAT superfamily N-acetyltransferase
VVEEAGQPDLLLRALAQPLYVPSRPFPIPLCRSSELTGSLPDFLSDSTDGWLSRVVLSFLDLRDWLFPVPNIDPHAAETFTRVFADIQPTIMNSDRRRNAWYLSTLCVEPKLQGSGLGSRLLLDGIQRVDRDGAAAWLIGLAGLDGFYGRYGFKEVARANVGELAHWDGGLIMFRE